LVDPQHMLALFQQLQIEVMQKSQIKDFFQLIEEKLISAFLEKLFSRYVDYNFTAGLEDQLDEITTGKESWIKVLELFWKDFNNNVLEVKEKRTREVLDLLNDSLGSLIFDKDKMEI
jgi:DNA topoisomerase-1